jgi:hypothetical protein
MKHIRFDASVTNHPPVGEAAKAIAVGIAQGSVTGLDQVLPSQFAFESQLLTSGRSNHPQPSQFKSRSPAGLWANREVAVGQIQECSRTKSTSCETQKAGARRSFPLTRSL